MKILNILFAFLLIQACYAQKDTPVVEFETSKGTFIVELYPDKAPITADNFLQYVEGGHYRGGSFFRTVTMDNQPQRPVKIEVIQGGIHPWREQDLRPPIKLERTHVTGVQHKDGTISMARLGPDSGQASFFICIGDQPELDYEGTRNPDGQGFAAFGKVTDGMEVVRSIHRSPAEGQGLMPPIIILDVRLRSTK